MRELISARDISDEGTRGMIQASIQWKLIVYRGGVNGNVGLSLINHRNVQSKKVRGIKCGSLCFTPML